MTLSRYYKIAPGLRQTCNVLAISPTRVLERINLPHDYLETEERGVEAATYFKLYDAVALESDDPELPLTLGRSASKGPFQPALLAFSSSPDLYTGLSRLSTFKPLVAPIRLQLSDTGDAFTVRFGTEGGHAMPHVMSALEIIIFLDFARTFTAHHIVPQAAHLPDFGYATPAYRDYIGAAVTPGRAASVTFHMEDALRPLVTADTEFYKLVERELNARLETAHQDRPLSNQVRKALTDLLPSGTVSADHVSARLGVSKRTLQRKLKVEGTSFQAILDDTRATLAITYLRDQKLSAEETSYLLAYQDPNSFYRAFHDWTGMTPAQARSAPVV